MNTLRIEEDWDIAEGQDEALLMEQESRIVEDREEKMVAGIHRRLLDLWDASEAGPGKEWERPDALRTQGSNEAVGECQDDCFKE